MKIKSYIKFIGNCILVISVGLIISCTKEGPQGIPGSDGLDGLDGTETCTACHNTTEIIKVKMSQYSNSVHASGANIDRNYMPCAGCHTSMGFRSKLDGNPLELVENPSPINCRTCHQIHESYTTNDFTLRTNTAVDLAVGNEATYDYGNSNLCANCHQARVMTPAPGLSSNDSVTITSPHYGPHHATQSNIFMGEGPVEISGSMPYVNSAHTNHVDGGCVTCHMSSASGLKAGGHQMGIKYESHGQDAYLYSGCTATDCHGSEDDVKALIGPNRIEIAGLEEHLKTLLIEKGLLGTNGLVPAPKKMSELDAAAIVNYKFIEGDHSLGAHNYRYTKALLSFTYKHY